VLLLLLLIPVSVLCFFVAYHQLSPKDGGPGNMSFPPAPPTLAPPSTTLRDAASLRVPVAKTVSDVPIPAPSLQRPLSARTVCSTHAQAALPAYMRPLTAIPHPQGHSLPAVPRALLLTASSCSDFRWARSNEIVFNPRGNFVIIPRASSSRAPPHPALLLIPRASSSRAPLHPARLLTGHSGALTRWQVYCLMPMRSICCCSLLAGHSLRQARPIPQTRSSRD
jgi:hypothetical protein